MTRILTQDRLTAIACMILAAAAIVAIPYQTSDRPIPGARGLDILDGAFFPKIAVALFLVAAIWLFVEGRGKGAVAARDLADAGPLSEAEPPEEEPALGISPRDFLWAVGISGSLVFYVQLLEPLGYLAATILGVTALAWVCGLRSLVGTVFVGLVYPAAVYYLFSRLFMVPLPRGDLWFG